MEDHAAKRAQVVMHAHHDAKLTGDELHMPDLTKQDALGELHAMFLGGLVFSGTRV